MNPHTQYRHGLQDGLNALWDRLDREPGNTDLQEAIDQLENLLADTIDKEEQWESERPRREAETRLAWHAENDTLDLY